MDFARLRKELVRDEGLRLKAYQDTRGFWTIGVGHLLGSVPRMTEITQDEAFALLDMDMRAAESAADRIVHLDDMNEVRQRAFTNMVFNRGEERVANSTSILPAIRLAMTNNLWEGVRTAILMSQWGKEVGARAVRLAQMFVSGVEDGG